MRRNYLWFIKGDAHRPLLEISQASVARHDPDATRTVWDLDEVAGAELTALPLMLANLTVIWEELAQMRHGDELVVLDCDTIVQAPLPLLHQGGVLADVAVTFRDHVKREADGTKVEGVAKTMPYNFGVTAWRRTIGGLEAALWMRERVARYSPSHQAWYGNQLALAELCGPAPATDDPDILVTRLPFDPAAPGRSITIARWPCAEWNYTPVAGEDTSHARVLHFKGHARDLMLPWARNLRLP